MLLAEERAEQPCAGVLAGAAADDLDAALDLAREACGWVGRRPPSALHRREGPHLSQKFGLGQNIGLGLVHQGCVLGRRDPKRIRPPGATGRRRRRRGGPAGRQGRAGCAGKARGTAARGTEDMRGSSLQPLRASETASWTPRSPHRASERKHAVRKVSASEAPSAMSSASRRSRSWTTTARVTATETRHPASAASPKPEIRPAAGRGSPRAGRRPPCPAAKLGSGSCRASLGPTPACRPSGGTRPSWSLLEHRGQRLLRHPPRLPEAGAAAPPRGCGVWSATVPARSSPTRSR